MRFKGLFLAFSLLFLLSSCKKSGEALVASSGFMNLTAWNRETAPIVPLNGDWEFYWEELIEPGEFEGLTPGYSKVPGKWNGYEVNGKKVGGRGYATFRLRVTLPDLEEVAFRNNSIGTSFRIWVNGEELVHSGTVSSNRSEVIPHYLSFIEPYFPQTNELEIVMQVANFDHRMGGIWQPLYIGEYDALSAARSTRLNFDLFLTGALLMMGAYHLFFFLNRKEEKSALYFFLFAIFIVLRIMTTEERFFLMLFPAISWKPLLFVEFNAFFLAVVSFVYFIDSLYPKESNATIRKIIGISAPVYVLFIALTPTYVFTRLLFPIQIIMLAWLIYTSYVLGKAVLRRRDGSRLIVIGLYISLLGIINDSLRSFAIIDSVYLTPFGVFLLFLIQAVALAVRFSNSLTREEDFSAGLEMIVEKRTRELEHERNKLRKKNELMQEELALARKIQMKFIPKSSPLPQVSFYYQPMEEVGGDFFDFISLSGGKIGVFISDVSGHGVPAAFITSILKSCVSEFSELAEKPAEFMESINKRLVPFTSGHFITAFYGIFDLRSRKLTYASAGHNPVYLINSEGIRTVGEESTGCPLGLFSNAELKSIGKSFSVHEADLKLGDKVFFYTDGLTEAVNREEKSVKPEAALEEFETILVEKVIPKFSDLPANLFIDNVMLNLVDFRGDSKFDDDVCLICFDVMD